MRVLVVSGFSACFEYFPGPSHSSEHRRGCEAPVVQRPELYLNMREMQLTYDALRTPRVSARPYADAGRWIPVPWRVVASWQDRSGTAYRAADLTRNPSLEGRGTISA